jgi:hypothetical protein
VSEQPEKPPKLDEALDANGESMPFTKLVGIYLAIVLVSALVWLGVLAWTPLGKFAGEGYVALLLPMWVCFGAGFVLALIGGVAVIAGKPAKKWGRWTIYSCITGFVFMVLCMLLVFVCDQAGAKLPF